MTAILVGVDGSGGSTAALRWAAVEARRRGAVVQATLVWSQPVFWSTGASYGAPMPEIGGLAEGAAAALVQAVEDADLPGGVVVEQMAVEGLAASALLDLSERAEMLVVGTRGQGGFARLMLGSVSSQCVTHARSPVVVVPPESPTPPDAQRVVVGVDGSGNAASALRWAIDRSAGTDDTVEAVFVHGGDDQEVDAERTLEELVTGTPASGRLVEGDPREVLVAEAADADLLVLGARGHTGLAGAFLGSVTTHVVHQTPGVVAVLPQVEEGS